jgi:mannosyltransferase
VTRTTLIGASVAILLLAAALRLPGLGDQSLWTDEIYSIDSAQWPLPVLLSVQDGHPPLFALLLKGLEAIRPSDLNGRLISAFAGIAAIAAMLALGCEIADRRTAVLAAFLLAIAPLHVWYSREGRMYSLVGLCSVASSWLLVRGLRGSRAAWAGFALVSAAGLATHYLYGAVVLAQMTFVVVRRLDDRLALRRLAVVGGGLLVLAVCALPLLGQEAVGFVGHQRRFEWLAVPYTAYTFVGGFGLGPPVELLHRARDIARITATYWPDVVAVAVVGGAVVWAATRALPSLGEWGTFLVLWLLVPAVVIFAGAWLKDGAYNVRYLFAAFPAFVMLVAAGIARAPRWYGLGCLAALVAVAAVSIGHDRFDSRYTREDLRAAARYLREHATGSDVPVAVSAHYVIEGLAHYDGPPHMEPLSIHPVQSPADAEAVLATLSAPGSWLVLSRDWEDDPAGYLNQALAKRPGAEAARFPGVRIFRFASAGADTRTVP